MKIFMVFLALMAVFLSAFAFTADLNHYALMQKNLKTVAEECACGAAMMISENGISYGYLDIDPVSARARAESICEKLSGCVPVLSAGEVCVDSVFVGENYVDVRLNYRQETDIFRLPFLELFSFSREAEYKWE